MRYECALEGLPFYAHHGLYKEERILGGEYVVDILVRFEIAEDSLISHLENAANYEWIYAIAKEEMAYGKDLVETVAQCILKRVRQGFPQSELVSVSVSKVNPAGLFKGGHARITVSTGG